MSSEIKVDTISENTSANGVAIDSVTLKDGGVTGTAAIVAGGGNGPTLGFQLKDTSGNAQPRLTNDANNDTVIRPGASGRQIMLANYANNATALNVDDSGHVTKPLQPAFLAVIASTQSNIANGNSVTFGTEVYDVNADFASSTFTAPVTGKYQLNFCVSVTELDYNATFSRVFLTTSNRTFGFGIVSEQNFDDADPDYFTFQGAMLMDMDANDTATLNWSQSGGSAQADVFDSTYFSGFLAC